MTHSKPTEKIPQHKIPVSVIIATKNEEHRIAECLAPLKAFSEIIIVDSNSTDKTASIAKDNDVTIINFTWNKKYPKKRGWILENITTKHEWIFFLDADEIVTLAFIKEVRNLFQTPRQESGFFVTSQYIWEGKTLKYGLQNKKLMLLNRTKMDFPILNDLAATSMGEIEGHYQPIKKAQHKNAPIGALKTKILHNACTDRKKWEAKHKDYAAWEHHMNTHKVWPKDPCLWRNIIKTIFRILPCRPAIAYLHSYILKQGFRDGKEGHNFAKSRALYYKMIHNVTLEMRKNKTKAPHPFNNTSPTK